MDQKKDPSQNARVVKESVRMPHLFHLAAIRLDFTRTMWCELYLLRKPVGDREIIVALDKDTTNNEHRMVRRSNLFHALRHASFPARPADQVIASPGSRGAFAAEGEARVGTA